MPSAEGFDSALPAAAGGKLQCISRVAADSTIMTQSHKRVFHLCVLVQALTQFYLLLLHPGKLQCINRVNGKVRQELPLTSPRSLAQAGPSALALASDDAEGTIYILSGIQLATPPCLVLASTAI